MANSACHGGCAGFVETNADTFPYCEPCAERAGLTTRAARRDLDDLADLDALPVYRPGTLRAVRPRR